MRIRRRTDSDGPAVHHAMCANLDHLNRHSDWTAVVNAQLQPLDGSTAIVAVLGERVVGGAGLEEADPGRFTVSYWVVSDMTGQGIASRMVQELTDLASDLGATDLYAGVSHGNDASVRVLLKNGYCLVAEFDTYDRYHRAAPTRRILSEDARVVGGDRRGPMTTREHCTTKRLRLDAATTADLDELHELYADPRVWEHFPSLRHTDEATTATMLDRWVASWRADGLGQWIVRDATTGAFLGHGGCAVREEVLWNLGYRFAPEAQGRGYATEVARYAVAAARQTRPDLPVVAYLLATNPGSGRVAEKAGLTLRHEGPDAGNPDPAAVRLVYADRELTAEEIAAAMR